MTTDNRETPSRAFAVKRSTCVRKYGVNGELSRDCVRFRQPSALAVDGVQEYLALLGTVILLTPEKWRLQREGRQSQRQGVEKKSDWLFDKPRSTYLLRVAV